MIYLIGLLSSGTGTVLIKLKIPLAVDHWIDSRRKRSHVLGSVTTNTRTAQSIWPGCGRDRAAEQSSGFPVHESIRPTPTSHYLIPQDIYVYIYTRTRTFMYLHTRTHLQLKRNKEGLGKKHIYINMSVCVCVHI